MVCLHQLLADHTVQHHLAFTQEWDGWYGAFPFLIETSCQLVATLEKGVWHGARLFSPFIFIYEMNVVFEMRLN